MKKKFIFVLFWKVVKYLVDLIKSDSYIDIFYDN